MPKPGSEGHGKSGHLSDRFRRKAPRRYFTFSLTSQYITIWQLKLQVRACGTYANELQLYIEASTRLLQLVQRPRQLQLYSTLQLYISSCTGTSVRKSGIGSFQFVPFGYTVVYCAVTSSFSQTPSYASFLLGKTEERLGFFNTQYLDRKNGVLQSARQKKLLKFRHLRLQKFRHLFWPGS